MTDKRIGYIDLASGILILWVMVFHSLSNCKAFNGTDPRVVLPYLVFSMPWFFYKSGQFFREGRGKEGIARDFRKFIVPFLVWSLVGYVFYLVIGLIQGTLSADYCLAQPWHFLSIFGYIPIDVPLWFILSLFFVRLIGEYLVRWKIHPLLCIATGIAIGWLCPKDGDPSVPVYLANIPAGVAFFMLGRWIHPYETKYWLMLPCIAGYIVFLATGAPLVGLHRNVLLQGHYLLWPVYATCGIVAFNNLCRWIDAAVSRSALKDFRPLSLVGRNAMTLLVTHALIYMPVARLSKMTPWQSVGLTVLLYLFLLIPLVILVDRRKQKKATP